MPEPENEPAETPKSSAPASGFSDETDDPNPLIGILLKVGSVLVFVVMQACVKSVGDVVPAGQIVFFRSAFAMVPILAYLAWQRELRTAFATSHPVSHVVRGTVGVCAMALGFFGLTRLPLHDAIAIGYAAPLLAVVFAAVFLGETVRIYRWSAVIVGMAGVLIVSWPKLTLLSQGDLGAGEAIGVIAILLSAGFGATAMLLVRRLIKSERTPTIVLYFSLSASVLALMSLPFGWVQLDWLTFSLLVLSGFTGGLGQIFLTQSYRFADVSTIAPFDYSSILFGLAIGYLLFSEVPAVQTLIGTAIVVGAGIFIIFREHRLGLERRGARRHVTPQG